MNQAWPHPVRDRDQPHHLVVHGEEQRVAGAVRGVTGAPFGGAAEIAGGDAPFPFLGFDLFVFLARFVVAAFPRHHTVPRDPPKSHFPDCDGGGFGKQPGDFLIAAPIRTLDGVGEMDVRAIPFAFAAVAQGRLHAALCRR
jgi:hypothetical protein